MGTSIEQKKEEIRKFIDSKKDGDFVSKFNFKIEIEKTLTDTEKKYIRDEELNPYYERKIEEAWKEIYERQIKSKKEEFKNKIGPRIGLVYSSLLEKKEDLDEKVKKTLSPIENKFIDEKEKEKNSLYDQQLSDLYEGELDKFWNKIISQRTEDLKKQKQNQFKNEIKDKMKIVYAKNKDKCDTKENLDEQIRESLTQEERDFLEEDEGKNVVNNYYNDQLDVFWIEIESKKIENIKKTEDEKNAFKENIKNLITNIYVINSNSIKEKGDLEEKVMLSLTEQEKTLIDKESSIKDYFDSELSLYWNDISKNKKTGLKNDFIGNINNIINDVYKINENKSKSDLKEEIIKSLKEKDEGLFNEVENDFNIKFEAFWTKINDIKAENKKERLNLFKGDLNNRIYDIYKINENVKSKEELKVEIINSLKEEEKGFLNEIQDDFNTKLDAFWKKIDDIKEQNRKEKLNTFRDDIYNKILNAYKINENVKTKEELKNEFISILKEEEKGFLNEIQDDFNTKLDAFWKKIDDIKEQNRKEKLNTFRDDIYNKILNAYKINENVKTKEELKNEFISTLKEEEKVFLNEIQDDFNTKLDGFWNKINDIKEQIKNEKLNTFKDDLYNKILNTYKIDENVKTRDELKNEIIHSLKEEEKEFLNEIQDYFNQKLESFWNKILNNREKIRLEKLSKFKLDLDNRIEQIYKMNDNINNKQELDQTIKDFLENDEKAFLNDIGDYYSQRLDNFWRKKIKESIFERINDSFELSKYCEKKEDFIKSIIDNLKLSEEESIILKEPNINKEFNNKCDFLWKNAEKERGIAKLINEQNERIRELQKQSEDKEAKMAEKQNELDTIIQNQVKEIQKINQEAEKMKNQHDEELKKISAENEAKIKELNDNIKKEKDEEQRKRQIEEQKRLQKIEEINKKYYDEVENKRKEKIRLIKEDIKKNETLFCMEEINNLEGIKNEDGNIIRVLIEKIFDNDQISDFVLDKLEIDLKKNKDKVKKAKHLNIILVGPSGVGKSTLINAIFETENLTKQGFGKPETQGISCIESETISFLRLSDSQGIEKNTRYGAEAICNEIKNYILEKLQTKEPDNYIHCIWYCWKGSRLEDSEVKVLKSLSSQYTLESLPVIIVYTNAIDDNEIKLARDYVKEELALDNDFIPILAQERIIRNTKVAPFGLDKLIEKSIDLAKGAVKSSCFEGLKEEIKSAISAEINQLTEQIKKNIDDEIKNIISNMDNDLKKIYKNNFNIILSVYYKYIFLNPSLIINNYEKPEIKFGKINFSISDKSQIDINNFVINYYSKILEIKQVNVNKLLELYSNELTDDIISFQLKFNIENDNLLKCTWSKEALLVTNRDYISENISKELEINALKNAFNFLIEPMLKLFEEYFIFMYQEGMKEESFIEQSISVVLNSFDDLEKKINEYTESKRKKYEESFNQEAPIPQEITVNKTQSRIKGMFKKRKGK